MSQTEQMELIDNLMSGNNEAVNERQQNLYAIKGYTSGSVGAILIMTTFVTGMIYIIAQWLRVNAIYDALFVSLLIGGTIFLVYGINRIGRYLGNRGLRFCMFLFAGESADLGYSQYEQLCHDVFHVRRMTVAGILYGLAIASAPLLLGVWQDEPILLALLSLFLFTVNFVTGVAFYGLLTFYYYAVKLGRIINVNLWQIHNPSTDFFIDVTRRLALIGGVYISVSMTSLFFSLLPLTELVIAYACFACLLLVSAIIVPPLPVVNKLRVAKDNALYGIDRQIHLSFYEDLSSEKPRSAQVDYEKVRTLLELRERVEGISTWPFRIKSFVAVVSIIILSSVPVILQILLERVIS